MLIHIAYSFLSTAQVPNECKGWHQCSKRHTISMLSEAMNIIILSVQTATFSKEIGILSKEGNIDKKSPLAKLNPVIDKDGLLNFGGRLKLADLTNQEKNTIILPGKHHVSTLLIHHYHEKVEHQGWTFTEGTICTAGIWLIGGKICISRVLHKCVFSETSREDGETEDVRLTRRTGEYVSALYLPRLLMSLDLGVWLRGMLEVV